MEKEALIALIRRYPEWESELDETGYPTGYVDCPICEGGGRFRRNRNTRELLSPVHKPGCPRALFETEHPKNHEQS